MSVAEPRPPLAPPATIDPDAARSLTAQCPYLTSADGAWRSATATRDHRCAAVTPAAALAAEKQRRLCLTAEHPTCATYIAAEEAHAGASKRASTLPRPVARTTPVIHDHGRIAIRMPVLRSDRSTGQTILVAVLGIAFAAVVIARLSASDTPTTPGGAVSTASPSAQTSASPAPTVARTPTTTPAPPPSDAVPSDGAVTSPAPTAASTAAASQTYKVRSGDTLSGIANRFGTTTKVLIALNGIADPSHLKVGQVLRLP